MLSDVPIECPVGIINSVNLKYEVLLLFHPHVKVRDIIYRTYICTDLYTGMESPLNQC